MKISKLWIQYLKWPLYLRISIIVFMIILTFGFTISQLEPDQFPTPFEGIWWSLVTISTVGYGDFVPKTVAGRLLGMVMIFIGASFITAYFSSLSASTVKKQNARIDGSLPFTGSQHVIIIGWNEKANELVKMLRKHRPFHSIVLIDSSLNSSPYLEEKIHFIKGEPANDRILERANIKEAQSVFITADQHKNEQYADMQTILILLAVKGLNPSVYTVCEILTETQTTNALRAGADEIIKSYQLTSHVMISSFLSPPQYSQILMELSPVNGTYTTLERIQNELVGLTFQEVHDQLFEREKILFGIKRGEEIVINPPRHYILLQDDELLIIKS